MKFGIEDRHFDILRRAVIDPLKAKGARVYIFGSRITGKHHSHSDVDLLFSVDEPLSAGFLATVKEQIEESNFPYTVDLVDEKELAESYRGSVFSQRQEL